MLDIATDRAAEARIFLIHLRGRIDSLTSHEFDRFFENIIQRGDRFFVMQAQELEYVSSAGIAALVRFQRELVRQGGKAVFVGLGDEIRLLFDFFGLSESFPTFESEALARDYLASQLTAMRRSLELTEERVYTERVGSHSTPTATGDEIPAVRAKPIAPIEPDDPLALETVADYERRRAAAGRPEANDTHETVEEYEARRASASAGEETVEDYERRRASQLESEDETVEQYEARRASRIEAADETVEEYESRRASTLSMEAEEVSERETVSTREPPGRPVHYFDEPFVMECKECATNLRIFKTGWHMCAACGIEFDALEDKRISYTSPP